MIILKKSSHRMTKTFWETINEHPLRVSSQYRDHPLAYIAEQGFCGRIPRAIRYDRLIVLLSTMTDWSCCTQTRRYDRLLSAMTDCTAKPDPTQHNRYPRLLYYTFFWTETEVPQAQIDHVHIPREALELVNLFISLELIPNKFRWNLVDIMCFQNFEHFQMNFVQSFAPIIHGVHMPNDSSSWSSCCEVCRRVILDV